MAPAYAKENGQEDGTVSERGIENGEAGVVGEIGLRFLTEGEAKVRNFQALDRQRLSSSQLPFFERLWIFVCAFEFF